MFSKELKEKIYDAIKNHSHSDGEVIVLGEIIELKSFGDERGTGVDITKEIIEINPYDKFTFGLSNYD